MFVCQICKVAQAKLVIVSYCVLHGARALHCKLEIDQVEMDQN